MHHPIMNPLLRSLSTAALLLGLMVAPSLHAQVGKPQPVTASLLSEQSTIAPGKEFRVAVKLVHQPTFHTYGKTLPEGVTGLPTQITWKLPDGWKVDDLPWPPTHETDSTGGVKTQGYDGTVHLPAKLTPPATLAPGSSVKLEATIKGLVCDPQSCMPITLPVSLELKVGDAPVADPGNASIFSAASATPASASSPGNSAASSQPTADVTKSATPAGSSNDQGLGTLLLFAFIGGLILNVMPCVFPVLAIKILGFVNQAGEDKRRVFHHGLAYTAGVMLSMLVLGALVVTAGLSWGGQLQSPIAVLLLAGFFLIFGLNMAGVFEVGTSAVGVGMELQSRSGLQGSFFSGLLATIVATPCAAPFLSVALAATLTLPALHSMLIFAFIGIGLAAPYLLLSIFPKLVKLLPRPGAWMETFKQAMSFLLFATVAFLVWVLTAMVDEYTLLRALFGLVLVAVACWIYGRWSAPVKARGTRVAAIVFALAFLTTGLALGWPKTGPGRNTEVAQSGLHWEKWSPETVASLRAEKKPVYIDFTARWCVTCQTNKLVYNSTALQDDFKKRGVVTLKADWTNYDERITEALKALDRAAVPVNVLYVPGREAPVILPNLLTVDNVTAALRELDTPGAKLSSAP